MQVQVLSFSPTQKKKTLPLSHSLTLSLFLHSLFKSLSLLHCWGAKNTSNINPGNKHHYIIQVSSVSSSTMCPANESGITRETDHLLIIQSEDNEEAPKPDRYIHGFLHQLPLNEVVEDLGLLGKIACPIAMTTLMMHSKSVISMLFLGHLGSSELAGGALAISFANITGFSVIKGLSMGMEPICCQAYGAKKWSIVSQTFQKTLCLLLLTAILISLLWLNMEPILLLLGQSQDITEVAKLYLKFSIPELIAQVHLNPLRVFLRTQCITKPMTYISAFGLILHFPINYFLVIYLNLGVKGVALASACNTINLNLGLLLYVVIANPELKPWHGLTFLSPFQGWKPVITLALPSVLAVCLEWWWYEIMLFLCGLLQNPQASVAAMGILIQTCGMLYVFPHSISLALSTRVGHELGANQPIRAQRTTAIGLSVAVALGIAAFIFATLVRSVWGRMYTSDIQTLELIATALPVVGFCEIGNCPQTAACGVLRGSAQPKVGAKINFIAFYLVGLPTAILMAFKIKIGFLGLWLGLVAAQGSCVCMMIYTLIRTDWKHETKRAEELTRVAGETDDVEASLLS